MRLIVISAVLLLKVTLGKSCASGKYTESGHCCNLCPVGYGLEETCGKENTKCQPCLPGTFSPSEGLGSCLPCSTCPPGVPMLMSCSATQDTQCECDTGFYFLSGLGVCAPCSRCRTGHGVVRECGPRGDTLCQKCGPGTFSEEDVSTKPCQACSQCSDDEVEIQSCMHNFDTLCMDKKLHIGPAGADGVLNIPNGAVMEENEEEDGSPAPGPSKFTPQDEGGSNNILVYVSVLAAVVLGLLVYVAYKCWRSCKQKKALSKARVAELATSPEGEKLQSDSGVFLDSYSLQDNQPSKGTKRDSKLDNRLYINLPPHKQEEVERLLQEASGRGWRHLGAALGYEPEQLDLFGRGEAPAHTLLSNWAQREGSTLGLLSSALNRIERPDAVTALNSTQQGVSVV
ncbi:tumor necrosis factor receptor superfamily member 16 isoform X1 [Poecilia reticulata]|uniref:tumor necrosis factor receptor superfamily member 16 isoform X1 n=2 Tax=Poecilia reticulata TaxID=8081 RepID=UPI0004A4975E|nr:PREDICTED: tumor necrosis factor receptor superfamily member 16-like isoform X1 [Poecilia reticulata]